MLLRAAILVTVLLTGYEAGAREAVLASEPVALSITVYRDPDRGADSAMNVSWPKGFAMISETRTVTLPAGESAVRFEGVAEGMVAVSAIVTGLPQGTIEKNRNADLLSPGALVDGTLGNRITVTRTNPATGAPTSESAIVRTRADGGLVLETQAGFEAVRCSGLPEKMTFHNVPAGLSAEPVFSINTRDDAGGTYQVVLTYLAWGFDWQAHYVATLAEGSRSDDVRFNLMSWLTILNDNGQSFEDAELLAVAGALSIESDFRELAGAPAPSPLRLVCYPLGSTAAGTPVPYYRTDAYGSPAPPPPPPPPAAVSMMDAQEIVLTASSRKSGLAVVAAEEDLGDLKLYRIPVPVSVAAKGLKQVAFLDEDDVKAKYLYTAGCDVWTNDGEGANPLGMLLATVNDKEHGLGVAMPMGGITIFEPGRYGDLLVGEEQLRDYASGQDVEIGIGQSTQVFSSCNRVGGADPDNQSRKWSRMAGTFTNANPGPVTVRLYLGSSDGWQVKGVRGYRLKDGQHISEFTVPANSTREIKWLTRSTRTD
ncbi:hypothetical protein [Altererythrobacter aquiaggeris]|uniref:DUF4139 domain-containing protein n=1 Tax=Aestuarierythrobacter aquiaggeris TaxID=1898396 RepID=UPI00301AA553